jgi:hypothetical protein
MTGQMLRKALLSAVLLGVCCAISVPMARPQSAKADENPLASIAWLTGGTWKAEAKAPDGKVTTVASQVRWAENGRAIEFATAFNGVPHYSGFYCWDPSRQAIAFWYTSSDGEFTQGTAKMDGNVLVQEFDHYTKDGKMQQLRSRIERTGENSYHWNVMANKDGNWTELIALNYARS